LACTHNDKYRGRDLMCIHMISAREKTDRLTYMHTHTHTYIYIYIYTHKKREIELFCMHK